MARHVGWSAATCCVPPPQWWCRSTSGSWRRALARRAGRGAGSSGGGILERVAAAYPGGGHGPHQPSPRLGWWAGDSGHVTPLRELTVRIATQLRLQMQGLPQRRLELTMGYVLEAWGWPAWDGGAKLEDQMQGFLTGQQPSGGAWRRAGKVGDGVQGDPVALGAWRWTQCPWRAARTYAQHAPSGGVLVWGLRRGRRAHG